MNRPRPGFAAHLRKYGIDRGAHRRVKTALRALEELANPVRGAIAEYVIEHGDDMGAHSLVCAALREMLGEFQ